jgi:tRNA A37 threonylcarbamoyladenosine dehydratase
MYWLLDLGGVGAYAAELICRAGVGSMTIVDGDHIHPSNRNRQLPALEKYRRIWPKQK